MTAVTVETGPPHSLYSTALVDHATRETRTQEGGRAYTLDHWGRLRRFLILGSDGGTYDTTPRELTREYAEIVTDTLREDGLRVVAEIVAVSEAGRAPRAEPAIFALALAAAADDPLTRRVALAALPRVARTGTQLFHFASYVRTLRGWGRGLRRAIGEWYNAKDPGALIYQAITYRQRDGWTHADLLRLGHPKAPTPAHDAIYKWIVDGALPSAETRALPDGDVFIRLDAYETLQRTTDAAAAARLIRDARLPRETVPIALLREVAVWEALLAEMPLTAMIRNLGVMSNVRLLTAGSEAARTIVTRLLDGDRLLKARVHPLAVLAALKGYSQGHGERSDSQWTPVPAVVVALDTAFYAAFGNVKPTGKRIRLALDVSSSMDGSMIAGMPSLSAREASAAMALVTARVEPNHEIVAYSETLRPVAISTRQRLEDVVAVLRSIPAGVTDHTATVRDALRRGRAVDAFLSFTDHTTWDDTYPSYARHYRQVTGIPARHGVVAMTAGALSLADPHDAGQLDVVGFDAATPEILRGFIAGEV